MRVDLTSDRLVGRPGYQSRLYADEFDVNVSALYLVYVTSTGKRHRTLGTRASSLESPVLNPGRLTDKRRNLAGN